MWETIEQHADLARLAPHPTVLDCPLVTRGSVAAARC